MRMSWRSAIVAVCLIAAPVSAQLSVTCPPGFNGTFNANKVGCTFCAEATSDCHFECVDTPPCVCPGGDPACCANNPCCNGCPDPKPLECELKHCDCSPSDCCSTICPAGAPAVGSHASLLLVGMLAALGIVAVRRRTRHR